MTTKLKAGDRVRPVGEGHMLSLGKVYTVCHIGSSGDVYVAGEEDSWDADRLKLVEREAPKTPRLPKSVAFVDGVGLEIDGEPFPYFLADSEPFRIDPDDDKGRMSVLTVRILVPHFPEGSV